MLAVGKRFLFEKFKMARTTPPNRKTGGVSIIVGRVVYTTRLPAELYPHVRGTLSNFLFN